MKRWYELWDSNGASLVGYFDTQAQALQVVRNSLMAHGEGSVASLILISESNENEGETPEVIAAGQDLLNLLRSGPVPSPGMR